MNETWYEARRWDELIVPITVVAQTEKMVTFLNNGKKIKCAKISSYGGYFKTIEEAKKYITTHFKNAVVDAEKKLEYAQDEYFKIVEKLKKC